MVDWLVNDQDPTLRRRWTGRVVQAGFTFQRSYAVLKLSELLTRRGGLAAARYEGAQDLDLAYFDGSQEYIQIKHEPGRIFTPTYLEEPFRHFAEDLVSSGEDARFRCRFVLAGQINPALLRIRAGRWAAADTSFLVAILETIPDLATVAAADRSKIAERLLSKTSVTVFGSSQDAAGAEDLEESEYTAADLLVAAAGMNVAKVGVQSDRIEEAIRRLEGALTRQRSFDVRDVTELVEDLLPETFPKRGSAIARMPPPSRNPQHDERRNAEFWDGGQVDWDVVMSGAVISREGADQIEQQIGNGKADGRVVAVLGSPGAGKSAIAMRIAWRVQCAGHATVIEIVDPSSEKAWTWLNDFARLSKSRVVAFADDALRSDVARQVLTTLDSELPIVVLTTAHPGSLTALRFRRAPVRLELNHLTDGEIIAAAALVGANPSFGEGELARLKAHGDVIALMDRLRGGSGLVNRMREILHAAMLENDAVPLEVFRLLSVATSLDVAVPPFLVERIENGQFAGALMQSLARGRVVRTRATGWLRIGHQLRGRAAVQVMTEGMSQQEASLLLGTLLFRFIDEVEASSAQERRFGIGLLHLAAQSEQTLLRGFEDRIFAFGARISAHANLAELLRLSTCLSSLGQEAQAEEMKSLALAKPLLTGIDAANYRSVMASEGRFLDAVPKLLAFYAQPDATFGRRGFLEMLCGPSGVDSDKRAVFSTLSTILVTGQTGADELDALLKLATQIRDPGMLRHAVDIAGSAVKHHADHAGLLRRACCLALRIDTSPNIPIVIDAAERALRRMADGAYPIDRRLVVEAGRLIASRAEECQAVRSFAAVKALVDADLGSPRETLRLFYAWYQAGAPAARQLAREFMRERASMGRVSDAELAILAHVPA